MRKFHLALAVTNLSESIADYSERLQAEPCVVIKDSYALWRTESVNFSITKAKKFSLKQLGWEIEESDSLSNSKQDVNGIIWEAFDFQSQLESLKEQWPDAKIDAQQDKLGKTPTSLEAKLTQLEVLVEKMQGQLSIDESLAIYERGTKLALACEQALNASEQKVRILMDESGTTAPFNWEESAK